MAVGCVFCAIIEGKIPAQVIMRSDDIIVIKDIAPKAPIHYLVIPIKHIADITALTPDDAAIIGQIFIAAQMLAKQLAGSQAFRLISNNGSDAGQSVFHLHVHFLSGKTMTDF
ncbi:MAG TPA: HIT domain-containing protein [Candidatus Babeliales bacterium]|jgi:histidine triad (HIT) family protein|nr:HIT domain-containing protein [Candidatus Babeliales bacterium]